MTKTKIPDWVVYPQEKWEQITPAQAGFDAVKFDSIVGNSQVEGARWEGEVHEERDWGAVLTRGGYLVQVWGDPTYKYQTASVGKAFSRALVGLAAGAGLIQPDDVIRETWTGRGQLSHPHKQLDQQYHWTLTWTTSSDQKTVRFITADFQSPTDSIGAKLPTHTAKRLGDKDFTRLAARQRTKEVPLCASAYRYTMLEHQWSKEVGETAQEVFLCDFSIDICSDGVKSAP